MDTSRVKHAAYGVGVLIVGLALTIVAVLYTEINEQIIDAVSWPVLAVGLSATGWLSWRQFRPAIRGTPAEA